MSKQIDNEHKLLTESKTLSQPMTLIYVAEANILILKCPCCDKIVAYCCHCSPILQRSDQTNVSSSTLDNNYQSGFASHKPFHNVVIPMFEANHTANTKDTTSVKKDLASPIRITPTKNSVVINNSLVDTKNTTDTTDITDTKNTTDTTDTKNINILDGVKNTDGKSEVYRGFDTSSQLAMVEFCYRVETKIGEIKLGANYYQILELGYKASKLEIQNAYLQLISEFDLDKIKGISIVKENLEVQLNSIITTVNIAAKTLLTESLRNDYDKKLFEPLADNIVRDKELIYSKIVLADNNQTNNIKVTNKETKNISSSNSTRVKDILTQKVDINLPPKLTKTIPTFDNRTNSVTSNMLLDTSLKDAQNKKGIEKNDQNILLSIGTDNIKEDILDKGKNQELVQAKPANKILNNPSNKFKKGYVFNPKELKATKVPIANDLYVLSLKCYDTLNYERAASTLQKALELDPDNALYWDQLGKIYSKIHNSQHRVELAFKEAIRLNPENVEYLTNLGTLYQNLGKHKQAAEIFQKIFQLKYQKSKFYQKIANLILQLRNVLTTRQQNSKEKQNSILIKLSSYCKSIFSFIKVCFIVISYKLTLQKETSSISPEINSEQRNKLNSLTKHKNSN